MNLNVYFENIVSRYADRTATVFNGRTQSYRELGERVVSLAAALKDKGLCPGASVSMLCGNSDAYLEILFACSRAGVLTEQLNYRLGVKMLARLLEESRSSLLFVSYRYLESARQAVGSLSRVVEIIVVDEIDGSRGLVYEALVNNSSSSQPAYPACDEDAFTMLYTSGTTGKPKGVLLSHRNIVSSTLQAVLETRWSGDDVVLYVLPMFHVSLSSAYCTLFCGGTLVVLDKFVPEEFPQIVERYGVSRTGLVPQMMQRLVDDTLENASAARALRTLNTVIYAGAPMSSSTLHAIERVFACDLYALYGMTETMGAVALLTPEDHAKLREYSRGEKLPVGRTALGFSIGVIDENGEDCALGDIGEIVVQGDSVMLGYTDEEMTEKVMFNRAYRTGDIGFFDEEGYISVIDRKNDMIISGGENVFPSEVEDCIRSMGCDIIDVVVVGVPDKAWGQAVGAAVVLRDGALVSGDAIARYCKDAIGSYKKPRTFLFCDHLPFNECGKVDRHKLVSMMHHDR